MTKSEAILLAVRAAQLVMSRSSPLVVDGKWGSYTMGVYEKLPLDQRIFVDRLLQSAGTTASELRAARVAQKAAAVVGMASATDLKGILFSAADEAGINRALLYGMARIESSLNPRAINGNSRGLLQMQPAAWADARVIRPDLPDYWNGVFDPVANARAGAAYVLTNIRRLAKAGYSGPLDAPVLYMAHQQGSAGFMELWRAYEGKPSLTNYVTSQAMLGNSPPDGKPATTDKKQFLSRWFDVVRRKLGDNSEAVAVAT